MPGPDEHANRIVTIRSRGATSLEVIASDTDRWEQINRMLHDDTIALYARNGGLFTLLFAQPLRTVVAMRADQITLNDDNVTVALLHDPR